MKILKIFSILLLTLFIVGCSYRVPIRTSQAYAVTIKLKGLAFSDTGFLNLGKEYTELQLYDAGEPVFKLKISQYTCIDSHCFEKDEFNKKFLSKNYNPQTLENILNGRPIFGKTGYKEEKDGFSQTIVKKNLHIKYFVRKNKIYFKDYKNRILIKMTKIGS